MLQLTPALFVRDNVSVFNTCARLGHHILDGITPFLIVRRFLVPGRIIWSAVDFDQDKARRVVLLLEDIESRDTRFLYAVTGVLNGGGPEGFNPIGLNMGKNMDYKHNILLFKVSLGYKNAASPPLSNC